MDRSGAMIREASVSVINMNSGTRRSVRSNAEGFYAVSSLSAGLYKITIRKEGFQTLARVSVPLQATEAGRFDFTLDIGSTHEVITVDSTTPLLNANDAASGIQVDTDRARSLPLNGRALQGLIELAPGVLATPANAGEAGQFSTNGQRPNTNYFTVDGVSANNGVSGSGLPGQFSGGALPSMTAIGSLHNLVSLGELQELRVQTSTFAPESGRLPGAQVSVNTRSGSNDLHGEVFGSFRNDSLMANDWFANRAKLDKGAHRLTDFGAVLGGPLQRDRTFGFASFERIDLRQPVTFDTVVPANEFRSRWLSAYPVANGPDLGNGTARYTAQVISPATVTTGSARLDRSLGDRGTMFARFSRAPSRNENGFLQRNSARFTSQTFTAGVITLAAGGLLTNDARVSVSRTVVGSDWSAGHARPVDFRQLLGSIGDGQQLYGVGVQGIPPLITGDSGSSRQTQWNFVDSISLPRGRHDLRFGIDYQRLAPKRQRDIVSVVGQYGSVESVVAGDMPELTYARAAAGESLIETLSVFAQDTWHATPRLNLTYGVRWELTPPPAYRTQPPEVTVGNLPITAPVLPPMPPDRAEGASSSPIWRTRYTQWAPRFGAAYRFNERGSLVLRAGAGLFYDLGFSSATDLLNGAPYNRWRNFLGPTVTPGTDSFYGFAPNLRLPYSLEWNTTLERGIGENAAVSAAYVGSSGRRLLRREAYPSETMFVPDVILATNNGTSNYHALQLQARSRSRRGLQGVVSYTWAHAIDNGSWDSGTFVVFPGLGPGQDRGRSNFDVRHSFQAALSYTLPKGWLASGMLRTRTGFPVDLVTFENPFGYGFDNSRPNYRGGAVWLDDPTAPGGKRINPAAFTAPQSGQGNLGRNAIDGFGLAQIDFALERQWNLRERGQLGLRLEAYNATNSASFADPVRYLSSPLFGTSTSLSGLMMGAGRPNSGLSPAFQPGGPRSLQISLSLRF